jgi:hypothetical protein
VDENYFSSLFVPPAKGGGMEIIMNYLLKAYCSDEWAEPAPSYLILTDMNLAQVDHLLGLIDLSAEQQEKNSMFNAMEYWYSPGFWINGLDSFRSPESIEDKLCESSYIPLKKLPKKIQSRNAKVVMATDLETVVVWHDSLYFKCHLKNTDCRCESTILSKEDLLKMREELLSRCKKAAS